MNLIPVLLLALIVLCLCGLLGSGAWILAAFAGKLGEKKRRGRNRSRRGDKAGGVSGADALITGELILTGLAVTAHVAAVVTGQSFSRCTMYFTGLLGAGALITAALCLFYLIHGYAFRSGHKASAHGEGKGHAGKPAAGVVRAAEPAERLLFFIFCGLVAAQLACLLGNAGVYAQGDMTVETVGSFLQTDGIYQVNPLTGQAYAGGIPSRLKLLCLPSLYGFFCRLSGLSPESVVTAAVPVWIFVSSYAAFFCVGKSLFPDSRKKRCVFLSVVVILIWAGSCFYSMDGFDLLYCGYRGVTVRNLVLMPYMISLCLRKRWKTAILCILAEACIVWTFYGLGACLLTAAGLFLGERGQRNDRIS